MERYKSVVKAVSVSGARHAFMLQDGVTWVSCFLRQNQNPVFQQAIKSVAQGQEYIFDCERNQRNFLNIVGITLPGQTQVITITQAQAPAPPPPPQAMAPLAPEAMPFPVPNGAPAPQAQPEPPAAPSQGAPVDVPKETNMKDIYISRQNSLTAASNIMVKFLDKLTIPEDEETLAEFVAWVMNTTVEIANKFSANTLRDGE